FSPSIMFTLTASGLSTRALARHSTSSFIIQPPHPLLCSLGFSDFLPNSGFFEQSSYGFRRLSTVVEPLNGLFGIDLNGLRLADRVIVTDFFDEPAVPRGTGICHHHPVERSLLAPHPSQANPGCQAFHLLVLDIVLL